MLAEMIADRLGCDVHRIQAADPYSEDYDETVQRSDGARAVDAWLRRTGLLNRG